MARLTKIAGALTDSEFNNAMKKFPRLSEKGCAVAYAILVNGQTFEGIVEQFGISRQQAHKWATNIYQAFQPDGWVTEVVTLPPDKMDEVRRMELDAREKWQKSLAPTRIVRDR